MAEQPSPPSVSPTVGHDALGRPTASRMSVPPSEPRSSRASFDALDAHVDRPARIQMIVALILGLVLVAIPLYLWRRPRAESISATIGTTDAGALPAVTAGGPGSAPDEKLTLGDPKVVSCHDAGPKTTPPEKCDHLPEIERLFAKAIEDSAGCASKDPGGGSIVWVLDVTFKRKTALAMAAKAGNTMKSKKVISSCEKTLRAKLPSLPYDTTKHEHARYFLSITATYPGASR
ncbi:MAG: hypothetical protein KIT84_15500 [Labilithrix sp.]|nr:hypothetical protein [Labilithrix sp.]MCW5812431.1 hypothetical protein [Labilithrix sp.]